MIHAQTGLFRVASLVLIAVCYCQRSLCAALDTKVTTASDLPAGGVLVEIVENIPDQPSWDFVPGPSSEAYVEPAFGFDVMPTRYSPRAVKIDRASPFLFRATARVQLSKGEHRLLLRARGAARLLADGQVLLSTRFPNLTADGHEEVPQVPVAVAPEIRYLRPGQFEALTNFFSDGADHVFTVETVIGMKARRPELGELSVSIANKNETFYLLSPDVRIPFTEEGWTAYEENRRAHWKTHDRNERERASTAETKYWQWRHDLAREFIARAGNTDSKNGSIDDFINAKLTTANVTPAPLTDDYAFLRRVTLDIVGTLPSPVQIDAFMRDTSVDRRVHAIDRLLAEPGWADHWVSYWQDVLAENPGIVKPMLNNTGPFRWWIYESFSDNKATDRFATELILMEGSAYYGGPAGFGMASENDVPMAQKAQIVAQAFLGMQMQCARCHDAPYHDFKQKDLFSLAAMLKREPQQVPLSSSIPTNANIVIGRLVKVTLKPGSKVEPAWPFHEVMPEEIPDGVVRDARDSREKLAALITDPRNTRFAKVLVNRVWKRYLGRGIVEPVDDWETAEPSHPELLDYLARELMTHDYDLKHVARLILSSETYQRQVRATVKFRKYAAIVSPPPGGKDPGEGEVLIEPSNLKPETRLFASPARRRMTAEQLVDSLFVAVGKPFNSEELNMDVDGRRPVKDFNNLGTPRRAWEFTSLSNERDRPALAMPRAQCVVDTLTSFGWRESRQGPQTVRDHSPNVLQPAALANGVLGNGRITRLSDDSAITELCLEDRPLTELIRAVFLRVLSRPPTSEEIKTFGGLLEPGYPERCLKPSGSQAHKSGGPPRAVSWANHLNPEATRIKQELERQARAGDPPTDRLRADWRERMEDMLWTLVNSPEFVFVP
jgi:hypothetical protein